MKKLLIILFLTALYRPAYSQDVKTGTGLGYTFNLHDQTSLLELRIEQMTDTLVYSWRLRGFAGGSYVILPDAVNNAQYMSFVQPAPSAPIILNHETLFCMISRSAFKTLQKEHHFTYDNTVFNEVAGDPLLVNNKPLDVLHVAAADEPIEMWILNNPVCPLVCSMKGNPLGINFTLKTITQQ